MKERQKGMSPKYRLNNILLSSNEVAPSLVILRGYAIRAQALAELDSQLRRFQSAQAVQFSGDKSGLPNLDVKKIMKDYNGDFSGRISSAESQCIRTGNPARIQQQPAARRPQLVYQPSVFQSNLLQILDASLSSSDSQSDEDEWRAWQCRLAKGFSRPGEDARQ